jgi:parallel beta-helix repeat protein
MESRYNMVIGNYFLRNNGSGIYIMLSSENQIVSNIATYHNESGIYIFYSENNSLTENIIETNECGIFLENSTLNIIHHNYLIANSRQLNQDKIRINYWNDTNREGNFWSDYKGTDKNGDGIGDTAIPHNDVDFYPLTEPKIIPEDEPLINKTSILILMVLMPIIITVLYLIFRRREQKRKINKNNIE